MIQQKIKQLPVGWKEVELRDIFELKYGSSLPKAKRISGKFFVYGSNGIVGEHNESITNGKTLIVGRKGSIGKINLSENSCFPIDTTYYIDETKVPCDLKFLYYLLGKLHLDQLNKSAAVPGLNRNDVYGIKVLLPPLSVQKKIVEILERAEGLKRRREEADGLMDDYLKSVFSEMFLGKGLEEEELEKVCEIRRDSVTPKKIAEDDFYIGLEHLESKTGTILKKLNALEQNLKSNKFRFDESCILYGKLRPYLNKIALPDFRGVCSTDILTLKPLEEKLNKYYLAFLLRRNEYVSKATSASIGANLPRLSPRTLAKFKIPLPPLALQKKFASIVERVEKIKEAQKKSWKEIDDLFGVLMQKAFRGEIV